MPPVVIVAKATSLLCLLSAGVIAAAVPRGAAAATTVTARETLALDVSGGKLVQMPSDAASVFVADPGIADVQTPAASRVFVFGKKPGRTTLFALSASGAPLLATTLDVRFPQAELQAQFRAEAGDAPVSLAYTANGAVLQGTVPDAAAAQRLQELATITVGPGVALRNQLQVSGATQINLRVRVAEVSRAVSRQLGFDWSSIFSVGNFAFGLQTGRFAAAGGTVVGTGVDQVFGSVASRRINGSAVLDAMATEGLVSLLAEPNLTAISGSTATFLAGGEFPIPVPQALGVTSIEYKQYGVSVAFTPTALSSGRIGMKVRPEVSAIDTTNAIAVNNISVPALTTRRAETDVELSSGQSFAIAGLIQNNANNSVRKLPWLGDIPVLGELFRSTAFQRNQTELVIVVTPYLVQPPVAPPADATGSVSVPSDLEELLYGRVSAPGRAGPGLVAAPRLRGSAGFLFE